MRARFATPDFQLGMILGSFGFYVAGVGAIIVILAEDLAVPVSSLSWMGSIMGVGLFIGAVLGPMVLRLGPQVTIAGASLAAAGMALIALGQSLPVVAVGAALQALVGAGIMLVIPTVLKSRRGSAAATPCSSPSPPWSSPGSSHCAAGTAPRTSPSPAPRMPPPARRRRRQGHPRRDPRAASSSQWW